MNDATNINICQCGNDTFRIFTTHIECLKCNCKSSIKFEYRIAPIQKNSEKEIQLIFLEELSKGVNRVIKKISDDKKVKDVKQALEVLSEEVTKETPRKAWYEVSLKTMIAECDNDKDIISLLGFIDRYQIKKWSVLEETEKRDSHQVKKEGIPNIINFSPTINVSPSLRQGDENNINAHDVSDSKLAAGDGNKL